MISTPPYQHGATGAIFVYSHTPLHGYMIYDTAGFFGLSSFEVSFLLWGGVPLFRCVSRTQDHAYIYVVSEPYFGGDLTTAAQKAMQAGVALNQNWLAGILRQVCVPRSGLRNTRSRGSAGLRCPWVVKT